MAVAWLFIACTLANPLSTHLASIENTNLFGVDMFREADIKPRLQFMQSPITPFFDDDVKAYLQGYFLYGIKETQEMLGRAATYSPIIEHYLEASGLPVQFKYLPMIESGYVPYAVSTNGAAGLWQIVPATATYLGLSIDEYLDERKDPCKSSEAAVKYLKHLYEKFGTWELALVAYNCGPTRLNRAIRTYGSKDFNKIKAGLPKETQRYLARFLAACYAGTYHQLHGLSPAPPDAVRADAMAARVHKAISLQQVALATGVDLCIIRTLNPAFKSNFLPMKPGGIFLTLPRSAWDRYLRSQQNEQPLLAAVP